MSVPGYIDVAYWGVEGIVRLICWFRGFLGRDLPNDNEMRCMYAPSRTEPSLCPVDSLDTGVSSEHARDTHIAVAV